MRVHATITISRGSCWQLAEADSERAGGFEPLRFLPPDKMVVLGLVTSKTGELEDKDTLKRRIDAAAQYAPLEQLGLSP